jgi:hypothetical protein
MPITDLLVDAAVGYEVISFMDDNRRYFEDGFWSDQPCWFV